MILWHVTFHTPPELPGLPRLLSASGEIQQHARYRHEGIHRQRETHCLFKYTLRGQGVFRDAGGEHLVPAGRGFLCEIRDRASAYYYPPDADEPWEFVYVCFGGPGVAGLVGEMVERYGPLYDLSPADPLVRRICAFRRYDSADYALHPPAGASMVYDLLTTLGTSREETRAAGASHALILRAREIVGESSEANLNATELAQRLGVSREHLTRVFRSETGLTPYRYILRQRMLTACRLLKETPLSIREISRRLGYGDPAHFHRNFRSVVHMAPGTFRSTGAMPVF